MEKKLMKKEIEEQIKKLNEQLEERKEYLNNETNEGYGNWAIDEKISELTAKIGVLTGLLKEVEEKENIEKMVEEKEKIEKMIEEREKKLEKIGILDGEWRKLKQNDEKKGIEKQIKKLNEQLEERKEYLNNETNEGYGNWEIDEKISDLTAKIDVLTDLLKKVEEKENIEKQLKENGKLSELEQKDVRKDNDGSTIIRIPDGEVIGKAEKMNGNDTQQPVVDVDSKTVKNSREQDNDGSTIIRIPDGEVIGKAEKNER